MSWWCVQVSNARITSADVQRVAADPVVGRQLLVEVDQRPARRAEAVADLRERPVGRSPGSSRFGHLRDRVGTDERPCERRTRPPRRRTPRRRSRRARRGRARSGRCRSRRRGRRARASRATPRSARSRAASASTGGSGSTRSAAAASRRSRSATGGFSAPTAPSQAATSRSRSASAAASACSAMYASIAAASSGSQASSAYAPTRSWNSLRVTSMRDRLPVLPAPARCGSVRAACATSRFLRESPAPRRPAGRSGHRSTPTRSPRAVRAGSRSTSARTCSAVTIAIASSPTSGIGTTVAASRAARRRRASSRRTTSTARRCASVPRNVRKRPASRIERLGPLPDRQEHLLGHVLGGVAITDHPGRQPEHVRAELVVEVGEHRRIPGHEAVPHRQLPRSTRRVDHRAVSTRIGTRLFVARRSPDHRFSFGSPASFAAENSLTTRGNACRICSASRARPRS